MKVFTAWRISGRIDHVTKAVATIVTRDRPEDAFIHRILNVEGPYVVEPTSVLVVDPTSYVQVPPNSHDVKIGNLTDVKA